MRENTFGVIDSLDVLSLNFCNKSYERSRQVSPASDASLALKTSFDVSVKFGLHFEHFIKVNKHYKCHKVVFHAYERGKS